MTASANPVVIAVDGSDRAAHVADEGFRYAAALGRPVVLVRAVGLPPELPPDAIALSPDALLDRLVRAAEDGLARLAAGRPCARVARVGTAVDVVLGEVEATHAAVLVIGSHGYRPLERMLGTTASRLVDRAHVSVLVVR